jgi:uracil-DNA glycosylase
MPAMRLNTRVRCLEFPCGDVDHSRYRVPAVDLDPERIRIVLISEGAAADPTDDYQAPGDPLFLRTTLEAFGDAGVTASSLAGLHRLGIYVTSAVKCAKTRPGIAAATITECSQLLEAELAQFTGARAYLLMGDVAIKAINAIARRAGEPRPIPAGSTYRIRDGELHWRNTRLFPSYLQAGPAFYIEASKRRMIAEDIRAALAVAGMAG